MKKVLDQKINLTLEGILNISPEFIQELKFSEEEKKHLISLKPPNIEDKIPIQELTMDDTMHYTCPLGIMEAKIGEKDNRVNSLVYNGAELSIIPENESIKAGLSMRALNLRLKEIGGHSTAIVRLSKNNLLVLQSGD
ncbi:hypothetical protein O181_064383 [Austropuccinia psidii MF-1]|uniref:Uncharacterized protein n=1 Tax=Austropuccinia psidii MF-1 TaxID=1389203 RepID=A0A9Q3ETE1_9BASI|nr:hypothetical protein [Austropuccinia psidii MF-1]